LRPAARARSVVAPPACSSLIVGARSRSARVDTRLDGLDGGFVGAFRRHLTTVTTQLHTTLLCRCERRLRARADHAGLHLGDSNHLLQQKTARRSFDLREIREANVNLGLKQTA
jgi:hypothetical protein